LVEIRKPFRKRNVRLARPEWPQVVYHKTTDRGMRLVLTDVGYTNDLVERSRTVRTARFFI